MAPELRRNQQPHRLDGVAAVRVVIPAGRCNCVKPCWALASAAAWLSKSNIGEYNGQTSKALIVGSWAAIWPKQELPKVRVTDVLDQSD